MPFLLRQRLFFFGLVSFLCAILIAKVVWPLASRAATSQLGNLNNTNTSTQTTNTSNNTGPTSCGPSGTPQPSCSGSVNMLDYVAPDCGHGSGAKKCDSISATSVVNGGSYITSIPNSVEWLDATTFKQNSGDIHFLYRVDGGMIKFLQDTIWAPPIRNCDGTSSRAFYRIFNGSDTSNAGQSNWGGDQYPAQMSCGQTFSHTQFIDTYPRPTDIETNPLQWISADCNVTGQTKIPTTNATQLIFQGSAMCGSKPVDAIATYNSGGAGSGELYFYCKGIGLCAFYFPFDFSKSQPADWAGKDICNLQAGSGANTNYYEYNIQRADSKTILTNFYDEYSATCLPKQDYQLSISNANKCLTPGTTCPSLNNWDVAAKFTLSANNKLFGLFRNENKVKSRDAANQPAADRLESIEAYMSIGNPLVQSSSEQSNNNSVLNTGSLVNQSAAALSVYQAPMFKLLTSVQECETIKDKLRAVDWLCKHPVESDPQAMCTDDQKCALDVPIPNTTYQSHTALWNQIKNRSCSDLMYPQTGDNAGIQLRDAVLAVNPSLEMAYRPAFIVAVTDFLGKAGEANVNAYAYPQEGDKDVAFQTVDYLEVKVPAFGSDILSPSQSPATAPGGSSDPNDPSNPKLNLSTDRNSYRDPLLKTADLLLTPGQQKFYQQQEQNDRNTVRAAGGFDLKQASNAGGGKPIFCFENNQLKNCTDLQDKLPAALLTFINAQGALSQSPTHPDNLSCSGTEKDFYSPQNKKKIAEQVQQIGSDLETRDKVGKYTKKKEIDLNLTVHIDNMLQAANLGNTVTHLYFVSPHNYGLFYAQQAMLAFLTKNQQQQLQAERFFSDGNLSPEKFSPLLKMGLNENVSGETDQTGYEPGAAQAAPPQGTPAPTVQNPNSFQISAGIKNPTDDNGKPQKHPLFEHIAGQIASIPTRLMALLTTPFNNPLNIYTRSCKSDVNGGNDPQNQTATEDWLTGQCQIQGASPQPTNQCKPQNPANVNTANVSGDTAITDGVIALAIQASKYTCTPAEVLVGVLAKESRGYADNNNNPLTGDANQLDTRGGDVAGVIGAYQFPQSEIQDQYGTYKAGIQPCLDGLAKDAGLNWQDLDTHKVGVSMCVAAAWMHRGTYCSDHSCTYAMRGSNYACDGKIHTLSDFSQDEVLAGVADFHGLTNANSNYWDAIQKYKAAVDRVRSQMTSCLLPAVLP